MVYLYLLCFIRHRYQKFHDNLIHALIFQVRKVIDAAKLATQEKILHTQADHQDNLRHLSRILHLFLDDSIADDVTFGDVKRRAFAILDRDRVQQLSQSMQNPSGQDRVWEWDFIAAEAPAFKQHLRPVIMALSFAGHQGDQALLDAVDFLKTSFDKGRSLTRSRLDQIPQAFIPSGLRPYLYEEDDQGKKRLHPDKYEFLVYRLLRNHLEAGDVYVSDSLRFRSFEEDLIPQPAWQENKAQILQQAAIPGLAKPLPDLLQDLERELEAQYTAVNRRIVSGENAHIKVTKRRNAVTWSLPYARDDDGVNHPFFESLPQVNIAYVLHFVDSRCHCLDAFEC